MCTCVRTFQPFPLHTRSYLSPLTLLWWLQTFSICRATSDGVWWQIWEPSSGSVWLRDEKSAVIQEPTVILPPKEHGLYPLGSKPLPAHAANEEWRFLAVSVCLLCIFFMLSWSRCISVTPTLCLLRVWFSMSLAANRVVLAALAIVVCVYH